MGMLERLSDVRGTIEGKIVAVVLAILLVLPMASISAFANNGDASDAPQNAVESTETVEAPAAEAAPAQTTVLNNTNENGGVSATNTDEQMPEEVKAFFEAVDALPPVDTVTVDNAIEIGEQVNAVIDMWEAMSVENGEREDVQKALDETVYPLFQAVLAAESVGDPNADPDAIGEETTSEEGAVEEGWGAKATTFAVEQPTSNVTKSAFSSFYPTTNTYNVVSGNWAETGYGRVQLTNDNPTATDYAYTWYYGGHYLGPAKGFYNLQCYSSNPSVATATAESTANGIKVNFSKGTGAGATTITVRYTVTELSVQSGIATDSDTRSAVSGELIYTVSDGASAQVVKDDAYSVLIDLNTGKSYLYTGSNWSGKAQKTVNGSTINFGLVYSNYFTFTNPRYSGNLNPVSIKGMNVGDYDQSVATLTASPYEWTNYKDDNGVTEKGPSFTVTGKESGTTSIKISTLLEWPVDLDWSYNLDYADRTWNTTIYVKVVGQAQKQDYKLIYDANSGSFGDDTQFVDSRSSADNSARFYIIDRTPEREGYEFLGWASSAADTEPSKVYATGSEITLTKSNPTKTIYAVWKEVTYTVTYTDGVKGETVFPDQSYENLKAGDATPAFVGTPSREGFDFMGWAPTVNPVVSPDDADEDSEIIYTATWEKKKAAQYTVVHEYYTNNTKDGEHRENISGKYVGNEIAENDIEKLPEYDGESYTFTSVNPNLPYTLVEGDNIITLRYDRTSSPQPPNPDNSDINNTKLLRVKVICDDTDANHGKSEHLRIRPTQNGVVEYSVGDVVKSTVEGYEWQCPVTVYPSDFKDRFDAGSGKKGAPHEYKEGTNPVTVMLYYKDGAWVTGTDLRDLNADVELAYEKNEKEGYYCNYVVFHVASKKEAPTPDKNGLVLAKKVNSNDSVDLTSDDREDELPYTITVTNNTNVNVQDMLVRDKMPDGMTLVEGSGSAKVNGVARDVSVNVNDYLDWTVDGVVPNGAEVVITYKATVSTNERASLKNVAKAFAKQAAASENTKNAAGSFVKAMMMLSSDYDYVSDSDSSSVTIPGATIATPEGYGDEFESNTDNAIVNVPKALKITGFAKVALYGEYLEAAKTTLGDAFEALGVEEPLQGDHNDFAEITIPADTDSFKLIYGLWVTGDPNAKYVVSDSDTTWVGGSPMEGTIPESGSAWVYVTKTFTPNDMYWWGDETHPSAQYVWNEASVAPSTTKDPVFTEEDSTRVVLTYTVKYIDGVEDEVIFNDKSIEDLRVGEDTPDFGDDPHRDGYVFAGWSPEVKESVSADDADGNGVIIYTAQWDVDQIGNNPDEPGNIEYSDGIPDKYQVIVTYSVENGILSEPTKVVVTLVDADGNNAEDGTATLESDQIPTATANDGYGNPVWTVKINNDESYMATEEPTEGYEIKDDTDFLVFFEPVPTYPGAIDPTPDDEGQPIQITPVTPTLAPVPTPTIPLPAPIQGFVDTAVNFLQTPVLPLAGIADDETPLADIEDEETPMSAFDHPFCWVHYYIILGIIITAIYGGGVIARRLGYNHKIKKYDDDVTGKEKKKGLETEPADNKAQVTI